MAFMIALYSAARREGAKGFIGNANDGTAHWFGADFMGRDVLSRIIGGARISLAVGAGAITLGSLVGMGVHDDVAKTYVRDLLGGAVLVGIDCAPDRAEAAGQLLRSAGGRDLSAVERVP